MRAWFAFCATNITYIPYMVQQDEYKSLMPICNGIETIDDDCIREYNSDLVAPAFDYSRAALWIITIFNLVICILCYKKRYLVNYILYLESIQFMVSLMIPSAMLSNRSNNFYIQRQSLRFLTYYCDQPGHIYFLVPYTAFALFFPVHVIYLKPLTPGTVAINVFLILTVFAGCCLLGMLISYIS